VEHRETDPVKLSAIHRKPDSKKDTVLSAPWPTTIAEVAREVLADPAPVTDATATAA